MKHLFSILMILTLTAHGQNLFNQDFDFSKKTPSASVNEEVKKPTVLSMSNSTKTEQAKSSTSSNLVCSAFIYCNKCSGVGTIQPRGNAPRIKVACSQCKGVSNDVLYLKPCTKCKNTRTVEINDPNYAFPERVNCGECSGRGYNKGQSFQVAEYDAGKQVTYFEALKICESVGNGWRLPRANELNGMYRFLHEKGLGSFNGSYWGYTPLDQSMTDAYVYHFNKGFSSSNFFEVPNNLRLVRTIP